MSAEETTSAASARKTSAAVTGLVATRAQLLALACDFDIGLLAKTVGMVIWAITETWDEGQVRYVSMASLSEHIGYRLGQRQVHPDRKSITQALNELEDAGYIETERRYCQGPGQAPALKSVRRSIHDALTHQETPFHTWTTKALLAAGYLTAEGDRTYPKPRRPRAPKVRIPKRAAKVGGKGVSGASGDGSNQDFLVPEEVLTNVVSDPKSPSNEASDPIDPKSNVATDPIEADPMWSEGGPKKVLKPEITTTTGERTEFEQTGDHHFADRFAPAGPERAPDEGRAPQDVSRTPSPPPRSSARSFYDADSTTADPRVTVTWEEVSSPQSMVEYLRRCLDPDVRSRLHARRCRELVDGLKQFEVAYPFSTEAERLYLLSWWAGERQCENANFLSEYMTMARPERDWADEYLSSVSPSNAVRWGWQHGLAARAASSNAPEDDDRLSPTGTEAAAPGLRVVR